MIEYIHILSNLEDALKNLPVLAKYHEKDVGDRISVIFALYAWYRKATLCFSSSGIMTGYSEASENKDPVLKQLHIMAMESLLEEGQAKDFRELWDSLVSVRFETLLGQEDRTPFVVCSYLVSGGPLDSYAQACGELMNEVSRVLDKAGAKSVYEISGKAGLLGDRYVNWTSYSVFIPDVKERFVDGFVRTLNGNRPLRYPDKDLFNPKGIDMSIKSIDAVVANYSVQGGHCRKEDRVESLSRFLENLLWYYENRPDMDLRTVVLVTETDFCNGDTWRPWREILLFYGLVESVTVVERGGNKWSAVSLNFSGGRDGIAFREIRASDGKADLGEEAAFDLPLAMVGQENYSFLPDDYRRKGGPVDDLWVALVGKPFTERERDLLKKNHILVSAETDSVLDEERGLIRLLKEDAASPLRRIHAVIVDAKAGYDAKHPFRYRGVFEAANLTGYGLPILIYADFPKQQLGEPLNCLLDCHPDSISFMDGKNPSSFESLVKLLRGKLGSASLEDASVISRYRAEVDAAGWLDETGETTKILVSFLREENRTGNRMEDASNLLTPLRVLAEKIFTGDRARQVGIFPPLKLGEVQQFLSDGEFYDSRSGRFYVLEDPDLMPKALCASFRYFIDMTNGASHSAAGKDDSIDVRGYMAECGWTGIYRACAQILLDLLMWFRRACQDGSRRSYSVRPLLNGTDTVQQIRIRDYYYIGKVHLAYKQGLREGLPASAIRLKRIGIEKFPVNDKIQVRYYSSDYEIIPERS